MRQLLYVSNTALEIGLNDLDRILTTSRRNNAMMGITGLLLFIDGGFLQILEGEERAVRELYTRIA
ncbi:MAG TPA: BLUF domain-containing protein, partial [Rhizomicrobium sp.]|nr:BLUF domain-containing protein [Rhizomicrobium sp.]